MTAIILALASSLCYGVADFLGGLASRKTSAVGVASCTQPLGLVVLLFAFPFFPGHARLEDLAWGGLSGLGYAVGIVLFYVGLTRSRMAIVSPIAAVVGAGVPVLFGYIVGERPVLMASVGVGLAVLAVALLSANSEEGGLRLHDPGVVPALGSGVGFGLSLLFLSRSGHGAGLWALLAAQIVSILGVWTWAALHPRPFHPDRATWMFIVVVSVVGMGGGIAYLFAVRSGLLPVVAVLVSLYPVSTILLAYALLRERLSLPQWVGVLCALGGTALIARASP
jgi:drug/metabolite transporter (DMT)-like permease